jgi:hypothetical protein
LLRAFWAPIRVSSTCFIQWKIYSKQNVIHLCG